MYFMKKNVSNMSSKIYINYHFTNTY